MPKFILKRLLQTIPVLLIIITLTFFMVRAAPGGPFSDERQLNEQVLKNLNEYYGLDKPLPIQYLNYLKNLLHFDLGYSFKYPGRTVNEIIRESFPVSLRLGLYSTLIALLIGMPVGILAALKKNTFFDYAPMSLAMLGICLPTFVLGPIFSLIFGIKLGWLNPSGWFDPLDWILPSATLGLFYAAYIARLTRGSMLDIVHQDFMRTAKAKGLSTLRIIIVHSLKGALVPVIAYLGPMLARILSGSFVIEQIFQIPGLGQHFIKAATNRDYTLVLGTVIFYATLIVLFNLIVDIIQALLNPRQRTAES